MLALNFLWANGNLELLHHSDDDAVPPCPLLCDAADLAHSFVFAKQALSTEGYPYLYIAGVFLHLSIEGCQNKSFFKILIAYVLYNGQEKVGKIVEDGDRCKVVISSQSDVNVYCEISNFKVMVSLLRKDSDLRLES